MTDEKYFYFKFLIDEKDGLMRGFMSSEKLEDVKGWSGSKKTEDKKAPTSTSPAPSGFAAVLNEFQNETEVFQISVPFLMSSSPLFQKLNADRSIRQYVVENGESIDETEPHLFRLPISHASTIAERNNRFKAIRSGISSLPSMFLVGLISAYDAFLGKLIREILLTKPDILSSSERNISFKELVSFGSVDLARERIIEKEVESVLRLSHADQIKWLENKIDLKLTKGLDIWPDFIELCERRNLLTHTKGVISSQYITVCKEHGYDTEKIRAGDVLKVDSSYYRKSVRIVTEFGLKLTQVVWRKLNPDDIDSAATELNDICYDMIVKKRYKLAQKMLKFGLQEMKKHGKEATRKRMVVNFANATKLDGDRIAANAVLESEDWSASGPDFAVCVAAVRDELDLTISLMRQVASLSLLDANSFREWPVFTNLRSDPKFVNAFEKIFEERLFPNTQGTSKIDPSSSQIDEDQKSGEPAGSDQDSTVH